MRVLLSTYGTRGDVQPFVALAKTLKGRGHEVAVCTPTGFRGLVDRHDVPYAHMGNAFLELTEVVLAAESRLEQRRLLKGFGAIIRAALDDEWRAAEAMQPDVVVYHAKALGSFHIAEKLGIPQVFAMPLPLTRTRAFPVPLLPFQTLGGWGNAASYRLVALGSALWSGATNDFREKTLGLSARGRFADTTRSHDGTPVPAVYGFSAHVVPRPADWAAHAHITGCWFLDEAAEWTPPPALTAFLEAGPPPVYVGFGSMGAAGAEARAAAVLGALQQTGERAVVATGWGALRPQEVPPNVHLLESAPHDWLFPRMKAVVHHGGAGTTMAGLRWGKPTVICPFFGDQPFWGHVVHRAGLGSAPVPQRNLSAPRLASAIRDALQEQVIARAVEVGRRMREEDGATRAAEVIERCALTGRSTREPRALAAQPR